MAGRFNVQANSSQPNNGALTLVQLLDEQQPYKEIHRLDDPELKISDNDKIQKIQGSLVGLAVGDALGASVEFRPNAYLKEHPVKDMQSGGTWGLAAGQWTDDTSMALCLAASLIIKGKSDSYDQFIRYKKWYRDGYMSSTGKCFDIGKSTREAITDFEKRQNEIHSKLLARNITPHDDRYNTMMEELIPKDRTGLKLGTLDSAGNGPLMRLAPIPCFFFQSYKDVKDNIDEATQLTHGDPKAIEACQFYAGLIWHALHDVPKDQLLDGNFYQKCLKLELHDDILEIAKGSYKNKNGYEGGIRGKGYVVNSLEAALWAFYNDENKFEKGVLSAINLGDDTDTTAAIYGELAGAVYGIKKIPSQWIARLYQGKFIMTVAKGLYVKGEQLKKEQRPSNRSDERDQKGRQASANKTTPGDQKTNEAHTKHPNTPSADDSSHRSNWDSMDDAPLGPGLITEN